jgi:hypothetical protein
MGELLGRLIALLGPDLGENWPDAVWLLEILPGEECFLAN